MSSFSEAWARRQGLHDDPDTDCYRLFDGRDEGLPGWTVDRYGSVALAQTFSAPEHEADVVAACADRGLSVVVRDRAERADARLVHGAWPETDPLLPREGRFVVRESGVSFGVDLLHGTNTGLFLDARPLRGWVREESAGRSVLNLFSYTSAFGVCAALGEAASTTNVDVVPSALERGRLNYRRNDLPVDPRDHQRSDAFETLRQARKRERTWDAVICDPPPVRHGRKGFDPRRDLRRLLRQSWERVAPGGWMLAVSAIPGRDRFEEVLPDARWSLLTRGDDFPGPVDRGTRAWVAVRSG